MAGFDPGTTRATKCSHLNRSATATLLELLKVAIATLRVLNSAQATAGAVVVSAGGIERSAGCRRSGTKFVIALFKFKI